MIRSKSRLAYFIQRVETLIILLAGGDKQTQERDIKTALNLAQDL